ncbi:MAG: hypothetical protein HC846_07415 [Blastocatellia bacterium]|nr:hypothetical protein [Blastocatellia bacterium]
MQKSNSTEVNYFHPTIIGLIASAVLTLLVIMVHEICKISIPRCSATRSPASSLSARSFFATRFGFSVRRRGLIFGAGCNCFSAQKTVEKHDQRSKNGGD